MTVQKVISISGASQDEIEAIYEGLKLLAGHPKPSDIARLAKKLKNNPSLLGKLIFFA